MAKNECPACGSPLVEKKMSKGMVRFACTKTLDPNCKSNGYLRHDKKETGSAPGTPAKEPITTSTTEPGTKPNSTSPGTPSGEPKRESVGEWIERQLRDIGGY